MNLAKISVKRPILIICIIIALMTFGIFCFTKLPVDHFPDSNIPWITVTAVYAGAGPNEIEMLVTKPLEDSISNAAGIKKITSKSLDNVSVVMAEFSQGMDAKYAEQLVRDKVNQTRAKLPRDVKEPVISKMDLSALPVLTVGLAADLTDAQLYDLADQVIKPRIEQVDKVGSVEIIGGRKREICVQLDQKKLKQKEMSVLQVADRIGAAGQNIPIGKVNEGKTEFSFRTIGDFKNTKDIANTIVGLYGNESPARVSDIGTVVDAVEDEKSRMRIDGSKALMFQIYRQSGSNTVSVAEAVKKQLASVQAEIESFPGHPKLTALIDSSEMVRDEVKDVYLTIALGILLTILTVFFFLGNARSTLITGMALPISLVGACGLLYITNCTVNLVTLMAMSLAVGLLIDDAIVVIENIYRHVEGGEKIREAVINGTGEIQLSVTAISLVVISVFLPMAFMNGIVGQMLRQYGLAVTFSMAISLFVALTIVPMLTAYLSNSKSHTAHGNAALWFLHPLTAFGRFQAWLSESYERLLGFVLKYPRTVLIISAAIFLICTASFLKVSKNFVSDFDKGILVVNLECAPGTNLDGIQQALNDVERIVKSSPDVGTTCLQGGSRNGELNKGTVFVKLKDERRMTTSQFKEWLRTQMGPVAYAHPIVQAYDDSGGGMSSPLVMDLTSTDSALLEDYAERIITRLKADSRLKDMDSSFRKGKPEFQVILNDDAARLYGISSKTMGMELRGRVEGFTPAKFREKGYEYDIRVHLIPGQQDLRKNFNEAYIPNINYRLIRLADVAKGQEANTVTSIDRMNRARHIQITGDLAPGIGLGDVMNSIDSIIKNEIKLPPQIRFSYSGRSDVYREMIGSVIIAFGFSVLFVFLILSSLYESFITPFTILLALPLALCGAFAALFITGKSFDLFAIFGIFMLVGVAGKNSILLVDFIRQRMNEGHDLASATISAGKDRLRPIIMTSMALIAGAIPVAIGINKASGMRTGMGIAIIGGLVSSTLLTLLVIPAVYSYIHRFEIWIDRHVLSRVIKSREEAEKSPDRETAPAIDRN